MQNERLFNHLFIYFGYFLFLLHHSLCICLCQYGTKTTPNSRQNTKEDAQHEMTNSLAKCVINALAKSISLSFLLISLPLVFFLDK